MTVAWSGGPNPLGLTDLEVATGDVGGLLPVGPLPVTDLDPLAALEAEAVRLLTLAKGRCVVGFSGGRDSSALLAVLLRVARRDGFDDPVAVTARWPGAADTDETAWQEHVAGELGVRAWEIVAPGTDVELLGELATGLLRRHGLLWPPPLAGLVPMAEVAAGGVLVTGEGGDNVLGGWKMGPVWEQVRRGRNLRRLWRSVVDVGLPGALRRRRALSRADCHQDWLTEPARRAYLATSAAEEVAFAPGSWPAYLARVHAERSVGLMLHSLSVLCGERGGTYAAPLLAPTFLAALARAGGRLGLGDRTAAMHAVFGADLSPTVTSRVSKATFGSVFWGPRTRQFVAEWDGTGLPAGLVDADALRAAWSTDVPVYHAALPLHAVWLSCNATQPIGRSAP